MTVQEVIDKILKEMCGGSKVDTACDVVIIGDVGMEVKGIVSTFMVTVNVIKESIKLGANFIITHEPTWFNGCDQDDWCQGDEVYLAKKKLLEDNHIAVWRLHDHAHFGGAVDYIYEGVISEFGWKGLEIPGSVAAPCITPLAFEFPETVILSDLADFFKKNHDMKVVRIIGNPQMRVKRFALLIGGVSLGLGREVMPMELMKKFNLDLMICGDITEWTTCEYINDAYQLGFNKAALMLGHERSEEPAMKWLTPWFQERVGEIPVTFVDAKEPFTYL